MKKILVPTDFSKSADNALNYAVQLAKHFEADVYLMHVYTVPIFAEDSIILTPEECLKEDALQSLEDRKKPIKKSHPYLKIIDTAIAGKPIDIISRYVEKEGIDLVIIGTQGVGYLRERVMGSTASTLLHQTKTPVMVIDKHVKFTIPKKIVLAVDFSETDDSVVLQPLIEFSATFKSHICILNIFGDKDVIPTFGEMAEGFRLEKSLKHTFHTFFEVQHPDVVTGINDFVQKHRMDLVVIISRKHSLIGRIFREPVTTGMTFHSLVPLLALHK